MRTSKTTFYSDLDIEYQQEYSGPYNNLSGYGVVMSEKDGKLSGFGRPVYFYEYTKESVGCFVKQFEKYGSVHYIDYMEDGLSEASKYLLKKGWMPTPYYTQIIDLTKSIEELHKDIRKSYQNLCNKYQPKINICSQDMFKEIHRKVFGCCRSDKTYAIQKQMCEQMKAFVLYEENGNAAGLFYDNGEHCYYASGPSVDGTPMHPIIWNAMKYAKSGGCKTFELGTQVFSGDTKNVGISSFKRGFGGKTYCYLEFNI